MQLNYQSMSCSNNWIITWKMRLVQTSTSYSEPFWLNMAKDQKTKMQPDESTQEAFRNSCFSPPRFPIEWSSRSFNLLWRGRYQCFFPLALTVCLCSEVPERKIKIPVIALPHKEKDNWDNSIRPQLLQLTTTSQRITAHWFSPSSSNKKHIQWSNVMKKVW